MFFFLLSIHLCNSSNFEFIPKTRSPPTIRQSSYIAYSKPRNSILLFGGTNKGEKLNDLWEFSLEKLFWERILILSAEAPCKFYIAATMWPCIFTSSIEPKFYIFSGSASFGSGILLWEFNFKDYIWKKSETNALSKIYDRYCCSYYNTDDVDYFVIVSGSIFYRLNSSSLEWEKFSPFSDEQEISTCVSIEYYNNSILLATVDYILSVQYFLLYSYSLTSLTWSLVNYTNEYFYECSLFTLGFIYRDDLYLICSKNYIFDDEKYDCIKMSFLKKENGIIPLKLFPDLPHNKTAITKTEDTLFIFGDKFFDSSNKFAKIPFNTLKYEIINENYIQPAPRSFHSMVTINSMLYVFGGIDSGNIFNDLWAFDLISEIWKPVLDKGDIPSPRYLHSAGSEGNIFVIWGGMSSTELKGDLFIFNSITEKWTELKPVTSYNPSPAKGACLVLKNMKFYIYGGERNSYKSNELWEYDMNSNEFKLLSSSGLEKVSSPYCWIDSDSFNVLLGSKEQELDEPSNFFFNLSSFTWHNLFNILDIIKYPLSSKMIIGDCFFTIGGGYVEYGPVYSFIYSSLKDQDYHYDEISFTSYVAGYVYFNKSIYVYGGGSGVDELLAPLVGNPTFAKFDIGIFSIQDRCNALCSLGTYMSKNFCKPCKKGTFKDKQGSSKCTKCKPGTYNDKIAATSSLQCIPCPFGYFNNETAAKKCKQCPANSYCPVGSILPLAYEHLTNIISSQPSSYKETDITEDLLLFRLLVIIPSFLIILFSLFIKKLSNYLEKLDIYDLRHIDDEINYVIKKKTKIGGLFTVFFIIGSLMITCTTILVYSKSNIQETKGQVPLIILESEVSSFNSKSLTVQLSLESFGGICETNSSCTSSISLSISKISFTSKKLSCKSYSNKTCVIEGTYKDAEFKTGAEINFKIKEQLSYTSGIRLTLTSSSSIPEEYSSISSFLIPSIKYVFIGNVASEFFYLVTPSLFQSESSQWESEATGYHISERNTPKGGSQATPDEFSFLSNLNVNLFIEINPSVLVTKRLLKQSFFFFSASLLGTVSGLFAGTGFLMSLFERQVEKVKKRLKNKKTVDNPKVIKNVKDGTVVKFEENSRIDDTFFKCEHDMKIETAGGQNEFEC